MKKIFALGLAGALAFSALTGTIATANAAPFHPHSAPHQNSYSSGGWGAGGIIAGAIIGLGIAAAAQPYYPQTYYAPYPTYPVYPANPAYYSGPYAGNAHIDWCLARYPNSYNPRTNTYVAYNGATYYCDSPYN